MKWHPRQPEAARQDANLSQVAALDGFSRAGEMYRDSDGKLAQRAWSKLHTASRALIPKFLIILSAITLSAVAFTVGAQNRLTKLAPEPSVIQLENGRGATTVVLAQNGNLSVPSYRVTAAIGSSNAIPEHAIQFKWTNQPTQSNATTSRSVLTGELSINTQVFVEPNVEYRGRIVFFWPDAEQAVDFTAVDRTTLSFQLARPKLDLTVLPGQADTGLIRIRNTGKAEIRILTVSSFDLIDSDSQRRLTLPADGKNLISNAIAPLQEYEVAFTIPRPTSAGLYTGTFDVVANGTVRQSIPLTLRSRGPVPGPNFSFLPFVLFGLTLALGYLLSNKLESWFHLGGLQRAEALISLQESRRGLTSAIEELTRLGQGRPADTFAQTRIRLDASLGELNELLGTVVEVPQSEIIAEAERFARVSMYARAFLGAAVVARKQWPGADQVTKLNQVLRDLDRVVPAADLNTYRDSLRAVIETAATDDSGASVPTRRVGFPIVPSVAALRDRIRRMASLHRLVVAVVVFISAYLMFYARDFTFGSLLDYLGVFLWTLGLTQTGSQILARARSTYTSQEDQ